MNANEIKLTGFEPAHFSRALSSIHADAYRVDEVKAYARELRRLCKKGGLNFGALWAQAKHETDKFRSDLWGENLNPAGIKDSDGKHKRYRNGVDAARAHVYHLWLYLKAGSALPELESELRNYDYLEGRYKAVNESGFMGAASVLADISEDGKGWATDPDYTAKVAAFYTLLFGEEGTPGRISVLIVSGHRNSSGGHPEETRLTVPLAQAYLAELKTAGIYRDYLQAIDGDGDPDDTLGSLATVGIKCREWIERQRASDRVPVMLDLHYESGGAGGVFAIVPDAPSDSWESNYLDVRLARALSGEIHKSTGLLVRWNGVREPGVMSEKQTGVGAQGFRLGMFSLTASTRAYAVRLVVEHGAIDQQPDRGIILAPGFEQRAARGAVAGLRLWAMFNNAELSRVALA